MSELRLRQSTEATGTQRVLALAKETEEISTMSLARLNEQTETIRRQEESMAGIQDKLNGAERHLRSIDSFWGMISNWFRRDNSQDHQNALKEENERFDSNRSSTVETAGSDALTLIKQQTQLSVERSTLSHCKNEAERKFDEQDRDLDAILGLVRNLSGQARAMGTTIDEHQDRLGHLRVQIDDADSRTRKVSDKAYKITKGL